MTSDTTNITGQSYGNGTYVASASSSWTGADDVTRAPFMAFDRNVAPEGNRPPDRTYWHSLELESNEPQWIALQMPTKIRLSKVELVSRNNAGDVGQRTLSQWDFPNSFTVEGSNNGTNWSTLLTVSDGASGPSSDWVHHRRKSWTVSTSETYDRFRIHVTGVGPDNKARDGDDHEDGDKTYVVLNQVTFFDDTSDLPIWNPFDSAFWDVENIALWIYAAILLVGLGITTVVVIQLL